jgi:serine/threonine protein phosphatase 1
MSDRLIIYGDLHGEYTKLQDLMNKISLSKKNDTLIFLGDYIDRGEHSRKVIDYIIDLQKNYNVVCLLGNHESLAIESIANPDSFIVNSWIQNGGYSTLANYDKDIKEMDSVHGDWLRSLKLIHETENHIFVHGHLRWDKDIDEQDEEACLWGRFDSIKPHKSGKTVVVGHTIQHGGHTDLGYKVCIDTGSFKPEGYITAMIIDGNKTGFVDSR